ncbi:MAG: PAS domain-containing sensor histidine kinase [Verrucomicrobiaceae bacterium]|nr:PAS domain-containing sensor histidine kinase [Verrucomicrobiaceae bacterium]
MIHSRIRHLLLAVAALLQAGVRAQEAFPGSPDTIAIVRKESLQAQSRLIRGVVTCVEDNMCFVQDDTGAMAVQLSAARKLVSTGDEIETGGRIVQFQYGPQLQAGGLKKLGSKPLPEPQTTSLAALVAGAAQDQLVRFRASVHDVAMVGKEVRLQLLAEPGPNQPVGSAWTLLWWRLDAAVPARRPDELLDALIEVTGVAMRGSGGRNQFTLARLVLNSETDIKVIEPGSPDIFTRPIRTVASLRAKPEPDCRRVRVHGTVSYHSDAGWFYFQDETGPARGASPFFLQLSADQRRATQKNEPLKPGDQIELVGVPFHREHAEDFMPWFMQCEWRVTGRARPPPFEPLRASKILGGNLDGRSVTLVARVTDASVEKNAAGFYSHHLALDDEGTPFGVLVQKSAKGDLPVQAGDYARIDGVVKAEQDENGVTRSFTLNANELTDIRPTTRPWHPARLLPWLLGLVAVALITGAWIASLRRQVRQQTARLVAANDQLSRFQQIVETSTDFVAMATLENKPLYMNPAGRKMLGIPLDADLTKIDFEEISTPEARHMMMKTGMPHAFAHGHWYAELNMRTLAGDEVPVSFLGLVIKSPDGTPQYISSIARDISERMALERQLRESNAGLLRFKAIADNMKDLVAMADLDKKTLYLNTAGRSMLGIGMDEDAVSLGFDSIYTRESLDTFEREGFAHAFKHGHWNAEITMLHRNGSIVPVDFSGLVLRNPDGSPLCMSCIAHDLTHRLALENQLRDSLEHERELNALKSGFVNTISHEFRTPLGIILFASSMLRRFNQTFTSEERTAQLDAIDEAVERMNELVEQSLSLGRAEVAAPKKTAFDVCKLSSRIIDEVMSATSRRSPITLESAGTMPAGYCDEMMLRTILVNLLGNAVKYSPAGSPVVLHVQHDGCEKAVFRVRDHGGGLSEEDLPKLFTTFHRGKAVQDIPGSGLGLAIVKRCVEALGGAVLARNAEGGGAEFIVELPIFPPPPS